MQEKGIDLLIWSTFLSIGNFDDFKKERKEKKRRVFIFFRNEEKMVA